MIDIETLSCEREALVLAICVVRFDEDKVYDHLLLYPDTREQATIGRKVDLTTALFWLSHPTVLTNIQSKPKKSLSFCQAQLSWFIDSMTANDNIVWAKSPSFDLQILKNLFGEDNLPWKFKNEQDVRTALLKMKQRGKELTLPSEPHDPLADALAQVQNVQTFLKI